MAEKSSICDSDEILVLGRIGNECFNSVKKLWLALIKAGILNEGVVIGIVMTRVEKSRNEPALMKFLEEKGGWNNDMKQFSTKSDWEQLKDRAFSEAPTEVPMHKWMNPCFDEPNSMIIPRALVPPHIPQDQVGDLTYGQLIQDPSFKIIKSFHPWETKYTNKERKQASAIAGLSMIHAIIWFVPHLKGFVIVKSAPHNRVVVLTKSLKEKYEPTVAARARYYFLEHGDILQFYRGEKLSQMGMLRVNQLDEDKISVELVEQDEINKIELDNIKEDMKAQTKENVELKRRVDNLERIIGLLQNSAGFQSTSP